MDEKGSLIKTIVGILGAIVIMIVTTWWNQEKYDVRYTLSESIPLGTSSKGIQQITVKNLSGVVVESLQVLIKSPVTNVSVVPHSATSQFKIIASNSPVEIAYPQLPPQSSFAITLETFSKGVTLTDLSIGHNRGSAVEALSQGRSKTLLVSFGIPAGFVLFAGAFLYLQIRDLSTDDWVRKANYRPEVFLAAARPWLVNERKWGELRLTALKSLTSAGAGTGAKLADTSVYKWLDKGAPPFVSGAELEQFSELARKAFTERIEQALGKMWQIRDCVDFLKTERPSSYPTENWEEFRGTCEAKFVGFKLSEMRWHLVETLREGKPEFLTTKSWNQILEECRRSLAADLSEKLRYSAQPWNDLQKAPLVLLSDQQQESLRKEAYSRQLRLWTDTTECHKPESVASLLKPDWMANEDFDKVLTKAKENVSLKKLQDDNSKMMRLLAGILNGAELPERDKIGLTDEMWEKLAELDTQIRVAKSKNRDDAAKLELEERKTTQLKEKVLQQLQVLHEFINDPTVVDRIEDYNNPFSAGNFEILKRLARQAQVSKKRS